MSVRPAYVPPQWCILVQECSALTQRSVRISLYQSAVILFFVLIVTICVLFFHSCHIFQQIACVQETATMYAGKSENCLPLGNKWSSQNCLFFLNFWRNVGLVISKLYSQLLHVVTATWKNLQVKFMTGQWLFCNIKEDTLTLDECTSTRLWQTCASFPEMTDLKNQNHYHVSCIFLRNFKWKYKS
jgi:hypothetical protein